MSLSNASVLSGATLVTPTGGTAISFTSLGIRNNTNPLHCTDDELSDRRVIVASYKPPKPSPGAPNGYTQARPAVVFKSPFTPADGNPTIETIRIEFGLDVRTTAARIAELKVIGVQMLQDPDFANLWLLGSLD